MTDILFQAIPFQALQAALRQRWLKLAVSLESLDSLSGLQSGYTGKLLAELPLKGLGRISFPCMLKALFLKLVVVDAGDEADHDLFCAVVSDFGELQDALVRRRDQLNMPLDDLAAALGLTRGEAKKLIARDRKPSVKYLDPLLKALRVALLPVEDYEARAALGHRLEPRRTKFTGRHWRYARRTSQRNPRAA